MNIFIIQPMTVLLLQLLFAYYIWSSIDCYLLNTAVIINASYMIGLCCLVMSLILQQKATLEIMAFCLILFYCRYIKFSGKKKLKLYSLLVFLMVKAVQKYFIFISFLLLVQDRSRECCFEISSKFIVVNSCSPG